MTLMKAAMKSQFYMAKAFGCLAMVLERLVAGQMTLGFWAKTERLSVLAGAEVRDSGFGGLGVGGSGSGAKVGKNRKGSEEVVENKGKEVENMMEEGNTKRVDWKGKGKAKEPEAEKEKETEDVEETEKIGETEEADGDKEGQEETLKDA